MKNRFELSEKNFNPPSQAARRIPVPITIGQPKDAPKPKRLQILVVTVFVSITGCSSLKPLKAGKATTAPKPGGLAQTLVQSQNPSQPSRQEQETIKIRTYAIPFSGPASSIQNPESSIAPFLVSDRTESRAKTELGAAQKDTSREFAAKLSSLKSLVWVGVIMFIFGIASAFWAPLKAIIGSFTTSVAITTGGLALIFLPSLIVGHELLILGAVVLAVGAWFLAHRHGRLHGELSTTHRLNRMLWNS